MHDQTTGSTTFSAATEPRAAHAPPAKVDAFELPWLPVADGPVSWPAQLKSLATENDPAAEFQGFVRLANTRMDFIRTARLDQALRRHFGDAPPPGQAVSVERLAVLGSSTLAHLLPAIRVAGLRRGLWLTTHEADYGQYFQELSDADSGLYRFAPTAVLFAFDTPHLTRDAGAGCDASHADTIVTDALSHIAECWRLAREAFRCPIVQQTLLPVCPTLFGNNEHRLPGSRARLTKTLNAALRDMADKAGVDLLALDDRVATDGLARWHDPTLWLRARQEISPLAAPLYGELVNRVLAAKRGRSFKCLVLDLDNTLWGGVIGDDGLEGIVLGQGSAMGEAFVAVQHYARQLSRRGIILAVCSKNDEAHALAPFEQHPDMVLKRGDVACFVANWNDKATNIRAIAQQLNIGLDSLVFVDDNPFERELVRGELPMVAVPEVPDDPALIPAFLADAGYFEGVAFTDEDRDRAVQYQDNLARAVLRTWATDLPSYLRGLEMRLIWRRFDRTGSRRIVQLINKTNQFNLTTRRYTDAGVLALIGDPHAFGLQLRLLDRFGDNGIIAIVIGRAMPDGDVLVDTWLMSCRVLGREVERATLLIVADEARRLGAKRLIGEYRPTAKNAMVLDHYEKLHFSGLGQATEGGIRYALELDHPLSPATFIDIQEDPGL